MKLLWLLCLLVSLSNWIFSQTHGYDNRWGHELAIPKPHIEGSTKSFVGNNIATDSLGRDFITFSETFPHNSSNFKVYQITASNNGSEWGVPTKFAPADSVIGACCVLPVIDKQGVLHAVFQAMEPHAVFYARSTNFGETWEGPIQVSNEVRYTIEAASITTDGSGRLHIFWHDGDPNISTMPAEVMYARSLNNGDTWQDIQMISEDDEKHSAFARCDLSGAMGDTIAVAWRDSVGFETGQNKQWDVVLGYSTNGGETWEMRTASGGLGSQWDPGVIVDKHNNIQVHYHYYPVGNPLNASIWAGMTQDLGITWKGGGFSQISPPDKRSLLSAFCYDSKNEVSWICWKDERDFITTRRSRADAMIAYSINNGITFSSPEFVNDWDTSSMGFKGISVDRNGALRLVCDFARPDSAPSTVYIKYRLPFVFPGDANNDGVVNISDFFIVASGYGTAGSLRETTSIIFRGNPPPPIWPFETNGINQLYLDCNGDGVVNLLDVAVTIVNRNKQH